MYPASISLKKKVDKPDTRFYSQENEQLVWDYTMRIIKPYL